MSALPNWLDQIYRHLCGALFGSPHSPFSHFGRFSAENKPIFAPLAKKFWSAVLIACLEGLDGSCRLVIPDWRSRTP